VWGCGVDSAGLVAGSYENTVMSLRVT
jgi:hypothetical protein